MESYHPMPGRLPRHGLGPDADRDIYPGIPGHVPGIIGGDYDLWQGGLNQPGRRRPIRGTAEAVWEVPVVLEAAGPAVDHRSHRNRVAYRNPDPDADLRNPPRTSRAEGRPGFPNMRRIRLMTGDRDRRRISFSRFS